MPSEQPGHGAVEADRLARSFNAALAGHYTIERELGRGGMAVVYLAHDVRHSRPVAIKVLRPELAASIGAQRFLREISTLSRLAHPHILPLLDSGEGNGLVYFVMPYVEGETLRKRLRRERQLPVNEAVRIAREVAEALDYAHRQNVLHRDIKPENILLEDGQAVVADFGIARAIGQALREMPGDSPDAMRTATGVSLGTPTYMSPEQAAGERTLDGRSDIYALGCVTHEMLAGEPPFTGTSAESIIRQHMLAEPPRISGVRAGVPAHVADAIQRVLAKTAADRFTRAKDYADALGSTEASLGQEPLERHRHRGWAVPALAGSLVIAAAGVVWALTRPDRSTPGAEATDPSYTIVADVDGSAPHEIRTAVRNLVAIRLNQSGVLRTVTASDLQRGLALAGLPDTMDVNVQIARELAFRESVRTVIAPHVDKLGTAFAVTVQVLNAEDGAVVAAEVRKAETDDRIIEAVGEAVDAVRKRLGERPSAVGATRALKGVATPSFEAFKHFVRAIEHQQADANMAECLSEARGAIRHDPEFASAWSLIGFCHNNNSGRQDSAIVAWQRALELPDRLSEAHQHNLKGVLALVRDGNPALALAEFEAAERMGLMGAGRNRAVVLAENFGGHEQAAELFRDHRERSPFGPDRILLLNSIRNLIALGRIAEAESLHRMIPQSSRSPAMQLSLAAAQHDWDELAKVAEFHDSAPGAALATRSAAAEGMAGAYAARGRLRDAARRLRSAAKNRSADVVALNRSEWLLGVMQVEFGEGPPPQIPEPESLRWRAIRAAYMGDSGVAMDRLEAVGSSGRSVGRRGVNTTSRVALALIDARRGRYDAVVASLAGHRHIYMPIERWWLLANAFERLGQPDSSAAYLGRLTARKGIYDEDNLLLVGIVYPFARFRLGRHYAARGDGARASEHFTAFLDTFTNPDPEFRWMVTEAQSELGKMALDR